MSRSQIDDWIRRKQERKTTQLTGMVTVGYEYDRVVGPRRIYAMVRIQVTPSAEFHFESKAEWPELSRHDDMVLDGILDALFGWQYEPVMARFVLVEIGYHPVHSASGAYYLAARRAVESLLAEMCEWGH